MSPITHGMIGWLTANISPHLNRREQILVVAAGVVPDLDGLGIIAQFFTSDASDPLFWYFRYHHVLLHNLFFSLLLAAMAFSLAVRRWLTTGLVCLSFHLHLVADLVGSRGSSPEDLWPIHYLFPFADTGQLSWNGAWELVSWQNYLVTVAALLFIIALAVKRGYSPLVLFLPRVDQKVVAALRGRFTR